MDAFDLEVRNATYRRFVELGRAPTVGEIADVVGAPPGDVQAAWGRLHDGHALVLGADGTIRMAAPFSGVPTSFRVEAAGRSWYANCGWDSIGIGAALGADSTVHTVCPDCDASIDYRITGGRVDPSDLVWHVLVPAASWWDDIGYT